MRIFLSAFHASSRGTTARRASSRDFVGITSSARRRIVSRVARVDCVDSSRANERVYFSTVFARALSPRRSRARRRARGCRARVDVDRRGALTPSIATSTRATREHFARETNDAKRVAPTRVVARGFSRSRATIERHRPREDAPTDRTTTTTNAEATAETSREKDGV